MQTKIVTFRNWLVSHAHYVSSIHSFQNTYINLFWSSLYSKWVESYLFEEYKMKVTQCGVVGYDTYTFKSCFSKWCKCFCFCYVRRRDQLWNWLSGDTDDGWIIQKISQTFRNSLIYQMGVSSSSCLFLMVLRLIDPPGNLYSGILQNRLFSVLWF